MIITGNWCRFGVYFPRNDTFLYKNRMPANEIGKNGLCERLCSCVCVCVFFSSWKDETVKMNVSFPLLYGWYENTHRTIFHNKCHRWHTLIKHTMTRKTHHRACWVYERACVHRSIDRIETFTLFDVAYVYYISILCVWVCEFADVYTGLRLSVFFL